MDFVANGSVCALPSSPPANRGRCPGALGGERGAAESAFFFACREEEEKKKKARGGFNFLKPIRSLALLLSTLSTLLLLPPCPIISLHHV
jgi:hypothetical protein